MKMIARAAIVLLVWASAGAAGQTGLAEGKACHEEAHADLKIAACTRALDSGDLSPSDLSITLNSRGFAWRMKEDYDKAITKR